MILYLKVECLRNDRGEVRGQLMVYMSDDIGGISVISRNSEGEWSMCTVVYESVGELGMSSDWGRGG